MASHQPDAHNNPPTPQSIPLQDLSRPPDSEDITDEGRLARRTTGTSRARGTISDRLGHGRRYERLAESSPSPRERVPPPARPHLAPPSNSGQSPYPDGTDGDTSPLEDVGGFQQALGFAGLTIQGEDTLWSTLAPRRARPDSATLHDGPSDSPELSPYSTPARRASEEVPTHSVFGENDTTPLNDPQYLQPAGGPWATPNRTPDEERLSFQSIRLSNQFSRGTMLGDDLAPAEPELGRPSGSFQGRSSSKGSRKQSLSPSAASSPLSRAGTMVRKMSQRVVNLSNEPEIVEQSIRRNSMIQPAPTPIHPPSAEPSHAATEGVEFDPVPITKGASLEFTGKAQRYWEQQINPLKGKSLGVFAANNPLRRRLCDLLVHP